MNYLRLLVLLFAAAASTFIVSAQSPEREAAIKHYLDGDDLRAILELEALLKKKEYDSDAAVINYLGMAYQNAQDLKGARKMFERAVKLDPANSTYRSNLAYSYLLTRQLDKSQENAKKAIGLDPSNMSAYFVLGTADRWEGKPQQALATAEKMISADPRFGPGYVLKSDVLVDLMGLKIAKGSTVKEEIDFLRQSVDVLEGGSKYDLKPSHRKALEEKLETIRTFYNFYSKDRSAPTAGTTSGPEPGITPVKIISRPRASYTDSARQSGVQGSVRVAVLLGADGRVQHILRLKSLGYGLDEQAMFAARQIVFQPKMKDGKPISSVMVIEYSFSLY